VIPAATYADQYWNLLRSDCRNTLIYAHTTSRILPTGDISIGSLTLPAPEAGDFVELILLCKLVTVHWTRHEVTGGGELVASLIRNLGSRWWFMVSFMLLSLYAM